MSKFLLLMLLALFVVALMRMVGEGAWFEVASLIVGLFTCRDEFKKLWDEVGDD